MKRSLLLHVVVGLAATGCLAFDYDFPNNMNGEYVISPTTGPKQPGTFNTKWSEYKNEQGGVEFFDVYMGPITHLYGQVWWKALPENPLPAELVQRFEGKGMAVVGYEVDQVRKGAGPNGEDVSVPINVSTCAQQLGSSTRKI